MKLREPVWSNVPKRRARRSGRFLEALFVVAIVGVVYVAAMRAFAPIPIKLRVVEAPNLLATQRTEAITFRATTGFWPRDAVAERATKDFAPARWQDGELVFAVTDRLLGALRDVEAVAPDTELAVSYRIATAPSGATVWLCGNRDAPAGFAAAPTQHTTIPTKYLPHFCRSGTPAP